MTRVHVIATGGTISSQRLSTAADGDEWRSCGGDELVDEVRSAIRARLGDGVVVTVEDAAAGPSSNLTVEAMARTAALARLAITRGADGVVVLHGTDTLESTVYVLDLLLGDLDAPVVVTGSMRVHSHPEPDGPANIVDSVVLAADPSARERGALVCLNGIVHRAVHVHKDSAVSVDAFSSTPFTPVGRVDVNGVQLAPPDDRRTPHATTLTAPVPLVSCYPGIPAAALEHALSVPGSERGGRVPGIVVEVFGDLNAPQQLWASIHHAWHAGVLVVLASRPFTDTSRSDGLDLLGSVGAGGLTAQKAVLATMAALGTTADRDAAADFVRRCAIPLERGDWAT